MNETRPRACPQPVHALQVADRVRRARFLLKARVASGQLAAAEVILACPFEAAGMPIAQLLASQRGWGEVRTRAFLNGVPLPQSTLIGSLTNGQRQNVVSLLTRQSAARIPIEAGRLW